MEDNIVDIDAQILEKLIYKHLAPARMISIDDRVRFGP